MRILFVMQWCRPEPDFKCIPMAKALMERGHEVQVLTGFPNYPEGKIYPGYRVRLWQKETIENVPIVRVPLYPSHDSSSFRRACNYASFAASASLMGPFLVRKPEVAYVYNPMGLPGILLKYFKGTPFVYDIQDLWPDSLVAARMIANRMIIWVLGHFFRFVYRQSHHLIVLSPGFRQCLIERGIAQDKISVIYNWCDEEHIAPQRRNAELSRSLGFAGKLTVLYAGNLGKAQALEIVVEAARILQTTQPQVLFALIGKGTEMESLRHQVMVSDLENVRFLPQVPPGQIGAIMAQADALLVHLRADSLFSITIPSKTQAYLAAGKPILMGVNGEARRLVERAGAGICFGSEKRDELVLAVTRLAQLTDREREIMGQKGLKFYQTHLSLSAAAENFEKIFRGVTSN
jgi:colanic acid biosynthesis glycosyl transferase WcaI